MNPLSRRRFLITTGGLVLLAACSSDDDSGGSGSTSVPVGGASGEQVLVRFFNDGVLAAGTPQRLPFGLGDANGVLASGGPEELEFAVLDSNGAEVTRQTVARHGAGLPRPYWPLQLELAETGLYTAQIKTGDGVASAAFTITPAEQVSIPKVGDELIAVDTPTVDDARGVTPICTREPACPLHEMTLTQALNTGKPVALLIGTPAYCQTGICGPVLDILLEEQANHPDVVMLHAEIYRDPERALSATSSAANAQGADLGQVTEIVQVYELPFEPVLYVADADGVIRSRLDSIYDQAELAEVLGAL